MVGFCPPEPPAPRTPASKLHLVGVRDTLLPEGLLAEVHQRVPGRVHRVWLLGRGVGGEGAWCTQGSREK